VKVISSVNATPSQTIMNMFLVKLKVACAAFASVISTDAVAAE
jgi:hypothetical protein